jgi:hypothetical protein
MWIYLLWENLHFAVYLLAALAAMMGMWLYLDAWGFTLSPRKAIGILGWLTLASSFFAGAANVELAQSLPFNLPRDLFLRVLPVLRMTGYLMIGIAIFYQPIFKKPKVKGLVPPEESKPAQMALVGITGPIVLTFGPMAAALLTALAYLRRATIGLERHVWQAVPVFTLFGIYELSWLAREWRNSSDPNWYRLGAQFGPAWMTEHAVLTLASLWLMAWVVRYLLRRLKTQLILSFTTISLLIFMVTTVTFSGFLLQYVQQSAIERLQTDARALKYTIQIQMDELTAFTQLMAHDPRWVEYLKSGDEGALAALSQEYLSSQKANEVVLMDSEGIVLMKGENPEEKGMSWSEDPLVQSAQRQEVQAGIWRQLGPLAPVLTLRATVPVIVDGQVFAIALTGNTLDNAFVDGIKQAVGLDAALLAGTQLSASSVTVPGEEGRWVGTDLGREELKEALLSSDPEPVDEVSTILNQQFLATYLPLVGIDQKTTGFLWVGIPYDDILKAIGEAMQMTFMVSVCLIVSSLLPSYLVAARISRQVK